MDPTSTTPPPIVSLPPVSVTPPPPSTSGLPKYLKLPILIYGAMAIYVLLFKNIPGLLGDTVRWLSIPMLITGGWLGLAMLGYGVSIIFIKTNTAIVRILAPIVGLVFGLVVFAGSIFLSFIASLSNASEGGT